MKVTVIKVTADGEQLSVEHNFSGDELKLHRAGKQHLREAFSPGFDLIDARLLEMNKRIMAANYLVQKLSPEARFAVDNVMDILHGRTAGPAVESVLDASRKEIAEARAKGEGPGTEAVVDAEGKPTGRRRKKAEPVAQGREDGPEAEAISLDDLMGRLSDAPLEAE
jgi:hypothetical protein